VVLVAGATGLVGSNIVRELVRQGYKVRGLVHSQRSADRLTSMQALTVKGDITDFDSLKPAFENVRFVFSCVGIIAETKTASFEEIHVRGVENLLELSKIAKIEHFVHISSLGTRENAAGRYHQTKYKAEQAIKVSGLKYTIFRPSLIFGPEDVFVNRFARLLKYNPIFPLIGSDKSEFQPVWVKDLVKCVVDSLKLDSASNQIFEIGGPSQMTLRQILEIIRKQNGYSRRFYPVIPMGLVSALVKLAEKVTRRLPITSEQLTMLQEDNTCDNSRIEAVFKIKLTSLEEGIRQYGTG